MLIFLFFFALWLLFNGRCTADVLGFGVVLSAVAAFFACRVCGWSLKRCRRDLSIALQLIAYFACLFIEIIKANVGVIKVILSKEEESIRPQIFPFDSGLHLPALQTILANSITITPGTYTMGIYDSTFMVHGLNTEFAEGTPDSDLNRRLVRMQQTLEAKDKKAKGAAK